MKKSKSKQEDKIPEEEVLPGYPVYSNDEDIYNTEMKELYRDDSPLDLAGEKEIKYPDDDLDVPGSELDDAGEITGDEDEENNYYSLGGDDHNDLDEDRDELWQSADS